jgi:sulfite oxidase
MLLADKHPDLIIHTSEPLNAGPPPERICEAFVTPNQLFFVRNHGTIPAIDPQTYRLSIDGMVREPLNLSLDELRERFPIVEVVATLQCAGNRRKELNAVAPIPGEVPWGFEAISNALWRGVRLRDVLEAAGVGAGAHHAACVGFDYVQRQGRTYNFGGSIPIAKALGPEVLLAFEMNGAPLPAAHGYPLRVVAPGYIGARSVKWLAGITLQTQPSSNYFQAQAYKLFPAHVRAETADWSCGEMLGAQTLSAVITTPCDGQVLAGEPLLVQGFALPHAGHTLRRVELSIDGGTTWRAARLLGDAEQWAWRLWELRVQLGIGWHELTARAFDTSRVAQPEDLRTVWNFKGYMNNAWHRVQLVARG